MLLKNMSFQVIEAVHEDTKTITKFNPQQVIEVSDVDGKWFQDRYNEVEMIFAPVAGEEKLTPETVEEVIEEPKNALECTICGKVCNSKLGLKSHLRTHK